MASTAILEGFHWRGCTNLLLATVSAVNLSAYMRLEPLALQGIGELVHHAPAFIRGGRPLGCLVLRQWAVHLPVSTQLTLSVDRRSQPAHLARHAFKQLEHAFIPWTGTERPWHHSKNRFNGRMDEIPHLVDVETTFGCRPCCVGVDDLSGTLARLLEPCPSRGARNRNGGRLRSSAGQAK